MSAAHPSATTLLPSLVRSMEEPVGGPVSADQAAANTTDAPHPGFSAEDAAHMRRALELAERGRYTSRPNPCVGTVLVRDGEVVGEGWHRTAGGRPHAEAWALQEAGERARGATAYVTLEPCCWTGRTGPCTDKLINAGVIRVVAAARDPHPRVDGVGFQRLREAGIVTHTGLFEAAANALNAGHTMRMRTGRPRVLLKLAASIDGRTAMADGTSQWITGPAARRDVHRLRAASGAILTGIGTALADDPSLTVRDAGPADLLPDGETAPELSQPLRVVLDSRGRLPSTSRLLQQPGESLVVTAGPEFAHAPGFVAPSDPAHGEGGVDLGAVLDELGRREVNDVMVECGATLGGSFIRAGLVNELVVYLAPKLLGDAARPLLNLPGLERIADAPRFTLLDAVTLGDDIRLRFTPAHVSG